LRRERVSSHRQVDPTSVQAKPGARFRKSLDILEFLKPMFERRYGLMRINAKSRFSPAKVVLLN
jgi:hypothetical protein